MAASSSAFVGSLMGDFTWFDAAGDDEADWRPHEAEALLTEKDDFSGDASVLGETSTLGGEISLSTCDSSLVGRLGKGLDG